MMPKFHTRRPLRLREYDYSSAGWYFVTICTHNRLNLFGNIQNNDVGADPCVGPSMQLNPIGEIIKKWWVKIPIKFSVSLDIYQIMPNHIHGIVIIKNMGEHMGSPLHIRQRQLLFSLIQWFKTMTTNQYMRNVYDSNWPRFNKRLWQRSYYDHIIRNEQSLNNIREYIINNPLKWLLDENNPRDAAINPRQSVYG